MPQPAGPATDVTPSEEELRACCAAAAWLDRVQDGRPYGDVAALVAASDAAVGALDDAGLEQALAAHARIGERRPGEDTEARWSRTEQAEALRAGDGLTRRLAEGNRRYQERFGQVFLIRAAGRSAEEMLAALEERLGNDPATEREVLRGELADIVRLRLRRLVPDGPAPDTGEGGR
jgi:2-oxo-4-hydroxy-4-carboxy-5-ureidoimidazoline decarboxylase